MLPHTHTYIYIYAHKHMHIYAHYCTTQDHLEFMIMVSNECLHKESEWFYLTNLIITFEYDQMYIKY